MVPQSSSNQDEGSTSSVAKYLRQLGEDVGPDSSGGKTLKATGTIVAAYSDWRLSLASNSSVSDVVWKAARVAWKPLIAPTTVEMDQFRQKIGVILTVDNNRRGTIFKKVPFRSRPQPLVVMRLLAEDNMAMGPWLATLVAAVHAGAAKAVASWARDTLTIVGAQGAVDFELQPEDTFILLRQAATAANTLVADLKAIAVNEYWAAVTQASLTEDLDNLPPLRHREIVGDWWKNLIDHYHEYEMPVYKVGTRQPKGIEFQGRTIAGSNDRQVVTTVEAFAERVRRDFLVGSRDGTYSTESTRILTRAKNMVSNLPEQHLEDVLKDGLLVILTKLASGSRIVTLDMTDNIAGLLALGMRHREDQAASKSSSYSVALCLAASGESCGSDGDESNPVICAQTSVGLFVPEISMLGFDDQDHVRWSLQAFRMDKLDDGSVVRYPENQEIPTSNDHAGTGPILNRPLAATDTISGVVVIENGVLNAICLVRGELTIVNFSRILARLLSFPWTTEALKVCDASCEAVENPDLLTFSYITPDIILRAVKQGEVCLGDGEHRILIIAGSNHEWQLLSLATAPGRIVHQGSICVQCAVRSANRSNAIGILAGAGSISDTVTPVQNTV